MEIYVDLAESNDYGVETTWLDGKIVKQKYISNNKTITLWQMKLKKHMFRLKQLNF